MRNLLHIALGVLIVTACSARQATPQAEKKAVAQKTTAKKNPALPTAQTGASAAHKSQTAAKPHARTAANGKTVASRNGKKAPVQTAAWRTRQTSPTPGRYKEIQAALASKGYLKAEDATGVWDQNSADALKKFQTEQNLGPTGKINSLSLIALGLGPEHDAATAKPPVVNQVPPPGQE